MEDLTKIIAAASPFIKPFIDTFFTPKLDSLKKKFNSDLNKNYISLIKHFAKYFDKTYKRVSIINTLVFKNTKVKIKEIYIPLTIQNDNLEQQGVKVINYPKAFIESYEKILITDSAGMGKSTLLKWIFIKAIDNKEAIPIFIELRRLSKEKKILEEIQEQISDLDSDFDISLLSSLIIEGGFLFLLDGYDEISLSDREVITKDIQQFISNSPKNNFILTSRPVDALSSFGDFEKFRINPLKKTEAFQLLKKYDKKKKIATLLIEKLQDPELENINDFLVNPLLVSLLFTAFEHKHKIPFKKHLFYRQVYDSNFDTHDLSKGESYTHDKHCKLDIDNFHRILRHIGYSCLGFRNSVEFSKDELLTLIRNAKKYCADLSFSESDFLSDILITVPLFNKDGIYYRWAHKSLQEYFAAQFIYLDTKEKQSEILRKIYNSQNLQSFINIVDLYSDIDPKSFRNIFLYEFLNDFKKHYYNSFKNLDERINLKEIEFRKEITFEISIIAFKLSDSNREGRQINRDLSFIRTQLGIKGTITYSASVMTSDENVQFAVAFLPKSSLCGILYKKGYEIIEISSSFNANSELPILYSSLDKLKAVIVSDEKDNYFNSFELFNIVNKRLNLLYFRRRPYKINSKKAFELLSEIEQQIALEQSDDFLINNF